MYLLTCATNEDSNQPAHPRSLIRAFVVRMKKFCIISYPKCAMRRFWLDSANAGSSLGALVRRNIAWRCSSCNKVLLQIEIGEMRYATNVDQDQPVRTSRLSSSTLFGHRIFKYREYESDRHKSYVHAQAVPGLCCSHVIRSNSVCIVPISSHAYMTDFPAYMPVFPSWFDGFWPDSFQHC